jgi:hypothetical protein
LDFAMASVVVESSPPDSNMIALSATLITPEVFM